MRKLNNTAIPRDGLVGEWLLDGDALDTAGSNDGTPTDVTWPTAEMGYVKEVGSFNGTSSYISIPNISSSVQTISFFARKTTTGNFGRVLGSSGGTYYLCQLYGNNTNYSKILAGQTLSFAQTDDTDYHHYIITADGTTAKIYVDGILKLSQSSTGNFSNFDQIGKYTTVNQSTNLWNGDIGLFRTFNNVLTNSERQALYQEGLRKLGPSNARLSGNFPHYSLPSLEQGKVLEISKPVNGGTYYDQSGNGNNGTPTNVVDSTNGLNNVMSFNGSDRHIAITSFDINNNYTISYWVNIASSGTYERCLTKWNGGNNDTGRGYYTQITNGGQLQGANNSNGSIFYQNSNLSIKYGKWNYLSYVFTSGVGFKLYINGVDAGISTTTGSVQDPGTNTDDILIGKLFFSSTNYYISDGNNISNPTIYNRALSPTEIQQLYYSNKII